MRAIRAKKDAPKAVVKSATPKKPVHKATKHVSLKPRVSEKAYSLSETRNTYVFDVLAEVNKLDIATAVTSQYNVTVTSVRLATAPGKTVRIYRQKGRRSLQGNKAAIRKAYVTLKDGDSLPFFAAAEEASTAKETK